jgi:hypothetical protein
MIMRALRHCTILLSAALSAACMTQQVSGPLSDKRAAQSAIVIVSATHEYAIGRSARAIFYIDSKEGFTRQRLLHTIEDVFGIPTGSDFEDLYGKVYVLELEPGKHSVDFWQVPTSGGRLMPRERPVPLDFIVQAGETIYLGNLHMQIARGRNVFGMPVAGDAVPEIRDRRDVDLAVAERKVPGIQSRAVVRTLPLGSWGRPADQTERRMDPPPVVPSPPSR